VVRIVIVTQGDKSPQSYLQEAAETAHAVAVLRDGPHDMCLCVEAGLHWPCWMIIADE